MPLHLVDCDQETHLDRHLCALASQKQMLTLARLAKNGEFICAICGRVAASSENLCTPVRLSQIE